MSAAKTLASIAAPAPQVVEEPTVQVKQQSAKQKARIDKGLPETHVEQIRVDGLVRVSHMYAIDAASEHRGSLTKWEEPRAMKKGGSSHSTHRSGVTSKTEPGSQPCRFLWC